MTDSTPKTDPAPQAEAKLQAGDVKTVKVKTTFGHEVEVSPDEAENLKRQGLDWDSKVAREKAAAKENAK